MKTQLFDNGLVAGVPDALSGTTSQLPGILGAIADLELAILIGSRATGYRKAFTWRHPMISRGL